MDELVALLDYALAVDPEGEEAAREACARGEQVEPHWAAVWKATKNVGAVACEEQIPEQWEAWETGDVEQLVTFIGEDELRETLSSEDAWAASIGDSEDDELREWAASIRSKVSRMRSQLSRPAPTRQRPRTSRARRARRIRVRSGSRGDPPGGDSEDDDPHGARQALRLAGARPDYVAAHRRRAA